MHDSLNQATREAAPCGEERRFAQFMEHLPGLAWIKDLQGRYVYANDAALAAFCTPRDALYGKTDAEVFPPQSAVEFAKNDRQVIERGTGVQVIETLRHPDGELHYSLVSKFPIRGDDGALAFVGGVAIDITHYRQSEERFRFLAETIPSMVWTAAADGTISYANRRWLEYCGLTPEQNAQGWPELVLHPDDYERCVTKWQEALREGKEYEIEVRNRRHDGVYRWFVTRALPLRDAGGRVISWFGVTTDIHDQKELQAQLRETARRKDEFLAILAHELRNPLAPIRNAARLLRARPPSESDIDWSQGVIDRQVDQLTRLVDDLLDLSRITRGQIQLRRERVPASSIVKNALETSRPLIEEAGHNITVALPNEWLFVHGDLTRLAQVVANLLNNAAKYTPRGGNIELIVERQEKELVLRVRDNGIGIPRAMLTQIFDMFTRVDAPLQQTKGLGIGLTLVQRLVDMHGGRVEAQSAGPGCGSEFIVRLPLLLNVPKGPVGDTRAGRRTALPRTPRRILVVDDNRDAANSLCRLLRAVGHDVQTAYDGIEALSKAATGKPQVVLLDIGLPGMNGYDVALKLREESWCKEALLIAVTGWGQEDDRRRSAESGFNQHLVKPVELDFLIELIDSQTPTLRA